MCATLEIRMPTSQRLFLRKAQVRADKHAEEAALSGISIKMERFSKTKWWTEFEAPEKDAVKLAEAHEAVGRAISELNIEEAELRHTATTRGADQEPLAQSSFVPQGNVALL